MVWHIEYEIFSAIIVIFLMVYFFRSKFIPTLQNKIYCALLIFSFLFIISNILGSFCLNNIDKNSNFYYFFIESDILIVIANTSSTCIILCYGYYLSRYKVYEKKIIIFIYTTYNLYNLIYYKSFYAYSIWIVKRNRLYTRLWICCNFCIFFLLCNIFSIFIF